MCRSSAWLLRRSQLPKLPLSSRPNRQHPLCLSLASRSPPTQQRSQMKTLSQLQSLLSPKLNNSQRQLSCQLGATSRLCCNSWVSRGEIMATVWRLWTWRRVPSTKRQRCWSKASISISAMSANLLKVLRDSARLSWRLGTTFTIASSSSRCARIQQLMSESWEILLLIDQVYSRLFNKIHRLSWSWLWRLTTTLRLPQHTSRCKAVPLQFQKAT